MSKFLKKTSSLILVLICLIAVTTYFSIQTIVTSTENKNLEKEIAIIKSEEQTRSDDMKADEETEDVEVISSLKEEIELKQKESEEYENSTKEIQYFLDTYDVAMDINLAEYVTYSEKQNHIKSTLSSLFTDEAWTNTPYYSICNKPEYIETDDGIRKPVYIASESKDIIRAYYKNVDEDSADVILKIDNISDKCTEYQIITVKKYEDNWLISNYQELNLEELN